MAEGEAGAGNGKRHLERLVLRSRLALLWERAWPPVAALLSVAAVFLSVSWIGLWDVLPHPARAAGVALFALALLAAAVCLARIGRPGRGAALARLDRSAGLGHRPATAVDDRLAARGDDPFTRALWNLHRNEAEAAAAGIRVARPSPRLDRFDPRAGRFLIALCAVVAFFVAGPDRSDRVAAAFDWWTPAPPPPPPRVDAWIAPPAYTGRPPLFLTGTATASSAAFSVPVGSTLLVRTSGGEVAVHPDGRIVPAPEEPGARSAGPPASVAPGSAAGAAAPAGTAREFRFAVAGDGAMRVSGRGLDTREWAFTAVPDAPPVIELKGKPAANARNGFVMTYAVSDDYGVVGAEARYAPLPRPGQTMPARPLYEAPKTQLALPQARMRQGEATTAADLQASPWAGATVEVRLVARDEAGQEGSSRGMTFQIPGRPFVDPLARALVEQRRDLALDAGARDRVRDAVDALSLFPERFDVPSSVFLGLRTAYWRLDMAKTDDDLRSVADYLWEMAVGIEEGDMTDAERQLRAAQEALKQALENGASDQDIKRLTDQLRQAMNEYMRELTKQLAQQPPADPRGMDPNAKVVRPQDLQRMLDRMEQLSEKGDRRAAQDMLAELNQMLNGLRNAQRAPRDQNAEAMGKMLDELGAMIRQQNQLRDKTFKEGRLGNGDPSRRGQQGQRGQGQRGQPGQRGQQGEDGQGGEPGRRGDGELGGLADAQRQLRQKLEQMQRQLRGRGMPGDGLGDAEQAMRGAEGSLGQGDPGNAVDQQGRALEALRKGAQNLASRMAGDDPGGEPGPGRPSARRGDGEDLDTDPLGRPSRSRNYDAGNSVKVPGEIEAQRARRVLEDIRRRLSEPTRSPEELQYLERLLEE